MAQRWLIAVAAPREAQAVMRGLGQGEQIPDLWTPFAAGDQFDIVRTGVGKANAAGAAARALDITRHRGVLSVGIAGALPGAGCGPGCGLGDVICATRSVFADEGVGTPGGFIPLSEVGFGCFPDGEMGVDHDRSLVEALAPISDHAGVIATVSWCSGDDACARGVVARTGAIAEAMEGAAVALAARQIAPWLGTGELRVISNTTGDRDGQVWALQESLKKLSGVLGPLADALV